MLLVGCTAPANGLTAVGVDEGGHLIVVLAWCGPTQPEIVTVYHEDERGEATDAVYVAPELTGQLASFRLDSARLTGWELEGAPRFGEVTAYHAYGATKDNRRSTTSVRFRLDTAKRLQPGQVLIQDANDVESIVSQEEFARMGQDPTRVECG